VGSAVTTSTAWELDNHSPQKPWKKFTSPTQQQVANEANIPNFYYCSTNGASSSSKVLYFRIQGEAENMLMGNEKFSYVMYQMHGKDNSRRAAIIDNQTLQYIADAKM